MDKELVAEWIRFANMDLTTAKFDLENMHPAPLEIICYHCQQSAEKFLKSISVALGLEVVKTHDLLKVLDQYQAKIEIPRNIVEIASMLTQFATKTRYPQQIELDETQTRRAITNAEQVKLWAEGVIEKIGKDTQPEQKDTAK